MDGKEHSAINTKKGEVTTMNENFTISGVNNLRTNVVSSSHFEIRKSEKEKIGLTNSDEDRSKTLTEENESPILCDESSMTNFVSNNSINLDYFYKLKGMASMSQFEGQAPQTYNYDPQILKNENINENKFNTGRWSAEEHQKFIEAMFLFGNEWKRVQQHIKTRSSTQARSHAQKFFIRLRKKFLEENDDNYNATNRNTSRNDKIFNWIKENVNYDTILKIVKSSGSSFGPTSSCSINSNNKNFNELFLMERKDKLCKIILNLISNASKTKRKIFNKDDDANNSLRGNLNIPFEDESGSRSVKNSNLDENIDYANINSSIYSGIADHSTNNYATNKYKLPSSFWDHKKFENKVINNFTKGLNTQLSNINNKVNLSLTRNNMCASPMNSARLNLNLSKIPNLSTGKFVEENALPISNSIVPTSEYFPFSSSPNGVGLFEEGNFNQDENPPGLINSIPHNISNNNSSSNTLLPSNNNYNNANMNNYINIVTINLGCNNNENLRDNNSVNKNVSVNCIDHSFCNCGSNNYGNKNLSCHPSSEQHTPEFKKLLIKEYNKIIKKNIKYPNTISSTNHLNIVNGSVETGVVKLNDNVVADREKETESDPFKLSFEESAIINHNQEENDICKLNLDLGHFFNTDN